MKCHHLISARAIKFLNYRRTNGCQPRCTALQFDLANGTRCSCDFPSAFLPSYWNCQCLITPRWMAQPNKWIHETP